MDLIILNNICNLGHCNYCIYNYQTITKGQKEFLSNIICAKMIVHNVEIIDFHLYTRKNAQPV